MLTRALLLVLLLPGSVTLAQTAPTSVPSAAPLPALYRPLFEKGTRWTFSGTHTEKWWNDDTRRTDVTRKAIRFSCMVAEVVERRGWRASRIDCTGAEKPTCAPLGYPLARVYVASERGLFAAEKLPTDERGYKDATKGSPILPARPKPEKRVERFGDKESPDLVLRSAVRQRTLRHRGRPLRAWCVRDETEEADPRKQELCLADAVGPLYLYYWHSGGSTDIHEARRDP